MAFKKKNLEIEVQSPEIRSKLHSKKVSIAGFDGSSIIASIDESQEFKIS